MEHTAPHLRRSRLLVAIMAIIGLVFVVRLFYLQIIQHDYYARQAILEHVSKFTIPASRGLIYVRDGESGIVPVVLNETVYTVYADPRYVKDTQQVTDALRRIAGGNVVRGFEQGLSNKELQYTVLARQVSKTQVKMLREAKLAGVGFQDESKRVYPEDQLAAHVLGFVNAEGKGQYGIEEGLNGELSGTDGLLKATTDVYGIPLSVGDDSVEITPQNGKNIVLTIDRTIQHKTEQILADGLAKAKATKGSAVVMNPNNGDVLAIANLPTYNPNEFSKVQDYRVFSNRAVSSPYEPGSVIKALTMGVGINERVITPEATYNNTGTLTIHDATIRNVLKSPLGPVTMVQVLEYSFNTGVVEVLKRLGGGEITSGGKQILYDYFKDRYYFGQKTGIALAGDAAGEIISPRHEQGGDVRYANMTFGQGMSATALQVAAAFSASINGGVYYTPQIVSGYVADDGKAFTSASKHIRNHSTISSDASSQLRRMLYEARKGSSVALGEKPGYVTGGKTGTAQVYDPATGNYSDKDTIGSYVGFGGQEKPEYVIMIRVDDANIPGYSGSAAAAPIFTELSNWLVDYLKIKPQGS